MWGGQLTFSTPMLFAIGFLTMFLIGGINGVFSAVVPVDFALHDTYWVVAHIHYVLFGGSVFGVFAGIYYWFPKMTGRMLNETLGKIQFVLMFIGFNLTFFPMHILGLEGMPRRIADYAPNAGLERPEPAGHDRRLHDRVQHAALPLERVHHAAAAASRPATTRGRATPSSGRPPRRRRPTTSTSCPRSAPSGRSSTLATGRPTGERRSDGRARSLTTATTTRPRGHGAEEGISNLSPRDDPVHHLRGDVLRRAVRGLLQRPGECADLAARGQRAFPRRQRDRPAVDHHHAC